MLAGRSTLEDGRRKNKVNLELKIMEKEKYDAKHRSPTAAKPWEGLSDNVSRRADEHASRYEVGSNVGCPDHLRTSSPGMVSGGDIVEARLSHFVPIGEWCWPPGEGSGVCVDQQRGYPQLSSSVYRALILWKCDMC